MKRPTILQRSPPLTCPVCKVRASLGVFQREDEMAAAKSHPARQWSLGCNKGRRPLYLRPLFIPANSNHRAETRVEQGGSSLRLRWLELALARSLPALIIRGASALLNAKKTCFPRHRHRFSRTRWRRPSCLSCSSQEESHSNMLERRPVRQFGPTLRHFQLAASRQR